MAKSPRRKVKCPFCGEYFYRDEQPYIFFKNRYWHKSCYDKKHSEEVANSAAIESLEKYICNLFSLDFVIPRIQRQIKDYVNKYHYTYSGIQKTLEYFFEIKKNPLEKANGGIGIVPYVYDDAKKYYETIFFAQQLNKDKTIDECISKKRQIIIKSPERKIKKNMIIDLDNILS